MREKRKDIRDSKEEYRRSGIWDLALDIIFPKRCPFCDGVTAPGQLVCDVCRSSLPYIGEDHCMKCGKKLPAGDQACCRDCRRTDHFFTKGRSLYVYDETIRGSIAGFKYHNRREYADFYGRDIALHLGAFIRDCRPACLIPVPISEEKRKQRGYNQAELLAKKIAEASGIPMSKDLVKRCRDTMPMKELTRTERMKNLSGAFKMTSHDVKCRSVIIVDDIYTTGSTIDAMASLLREAGVKDVFFVTLASGALV